MAKNFPVKITLTLDQEAADLFNAYCRQTQWGGRYARSWALRKMIWIHLGLWGNKSVMGWGQAWKNGRVDPRKAMTGEGQDAPAEQKEPSQSKRPDLRLV